MHRVKLDAFGLAQRVSSKAIAVSSFCMLVVLCVALQACASPKGSLDHRAKIVSADGIVLAESDEGSGARAYPEGSLTSAVVGSCYAEGAPEGVEQRYESDLLDGEDVELTLDMRIQRAAMDALGDSEGAVVVLNPENGAVLAMASTPSYDPNEEGVESKAAANHATEPHIPGSTFKTITLAAALESGTTSRMAHYSAPEQLTFEDGDVSNYGALYDTALTLKEAYAQSVNTVFAQVVLDTGVDRLTEMAGHFGFGRQIMDDFPLETSDVLNMDDSTELVKAWAGVGQAVYGEDGVLRGPVMTCVQGALIAATVSNGGTVYQPYLVSSIGGQKSKSALNPVVLDDGFLSRETLDYLDECMRAVVEEGTGKNAAVPGVDVCGKTGTAETASGEDDGWFIGYASDSSSHEKRYAFAVLVQGDGSSSAVGISRSLIAQLF